MKHPEETARTIVGLVEALWRVVACTGGPRTRFVDDMRSMMDSKFVRQGDLVVIGSVRWTTPCVRRYGTLISADLEPYPDHQQDDQEFRGPQWEPTTRKVWTIKGLDDQEYRWEDVSVTRVPNTLTSYGYL